MDPEDYTKSNIKVDSSLWEVGEVYYREFDDSPFTLVEIRYERYDGRCYVEYVGKYLQGGQAVVDRKRELILAEKVEKEETMSDIGKLFEVKDEFGTLLAINSSGKYVLEMKGQSGEVKAFNKEEVKEVVPFQFSVKFSSGGLYTFFGKEGSVEVGDILMRTDNGVIGSICVVKKVGVNSDKTTKPFVGVKLNTTKIEEV